MIVSGLMDYGEMCSGWGLGGLGAATSVIRSVWDAIYPHRRLPRSPLCALRPYLHARLLAQGLGDALRVAAGEAVDDARGAGALLLDVLGHLVQRA